VKVPWRAVSVYFAATVSIQQVTHSLNLSKVCSIQFTIKGFSTSPRASTTSFKKVSPFNANAQAHYTLSSNPLFTASTSLHDTQAGTSVFFPTPSAQSFYPQKSKANRVKKPLPPRSVRHQILAQARSFLPLFPVSQK
jgi:hypothetical protein